MNFKSPLSVVSLAAASIALAVGSAASAQEATINFTKCTTATPAFTNCSSPSGSGAITSWTQSQAPNYNTAPYFTVTMAATKGIWDFDGQQGNLNPSVELAQASGGTNGTLTIFDSTSGVGLGSPLAATGTAFNLQSFQISGTTNANSVCPGEPRVCTAGTTFNILGSNTDSTFVSVDSGKVPAFTGGSVDPDFETITDTSNAYYRYWEIEVGTSQNAPLYIDNIDVLVPEGGATSLYLLFAGAVCFGAMFFKRRGQLTA